MNEDVIVVDGECPVMIHLLECEVCHKKIMVNIGLIGTNHNAYVGVQCAGCLSVNDDFAVKFPNETAQLKEWAK